MSLPFSRNRLSLQKFFGKALPLDVSISEIQEIGFSAFIKSRVPLAYFFYSSLEEFNSEHIIFYLEAEKFEKQTFKSLEEMRRRAMSIIDSHIKESAPLEVNVDHKAKIEIHERLKRFDQTCFKEAKNQVKKILEEQYLRYKQTKIYSEMVAALDTNRVVYSNEQRFAAGRLLISYVKSKRKLGPKELSQQDSALKELLRAKVHEFCRDRLKIDFRD